MIVVAAQTKVMALACSNVVPALRIRLPKTTAASIYRTFSTRSRPRLSSYNRPSPPLYNPYSRTPCSKLDEAEIRYSDARNRFKNALTKYNVPPAACKIICELGRSCDDVSEMYRATTRLSEASMLLGHKDYTNKMEELTGGTNSRIGKSRSSGDSDYHGTNEGSAVQFAPSRIANVDAKIESHAGLDKKMWRNSDVDGHNPGAVPTTKLFEFDEAVGKVEAASKSLREATEKLEETMKYPASGRCKSILDHADRMHKVYREEHRNSKFILNTENGQLYVFILILGATVAIGTTAYDRIRGESTGPPSISTIESHISNDGYADTYQDDVGLLVILNDTDPISKACTFLDMCWSIFVGSLEGIAMLASFLAPTMGLAWVYMRVDIVDLFDLLEWLWPIEE